MDDFYNDRRDHNTSDSMYSYSYRYRDDNSSVHEGDYYTYNTQRRENPYQRKKSKKGGFGKTMGKCIVLAVIFGLVSGGIFLGINRIGGGKLAQNAAEQAEPPVRLNNTEVNSNIDLSESVVVSDVSDIVENVMPSIVAITNISQTEYYNWFGQTQTYDSESSGSGIIVSDDDDYLYIATNNHVVADAKSLTICFYDDKTVAAEVKGTEAGVDLAVLSVKKSDLDKETLASVKIAVMGDSDILRVGESAIAIGNALGYGQSVTTGVISALNREVTVQDPTTGNVITNELLQTDAAINPGNSGGALLNIRGEVIGINSVKYTDTDVEGMGYSIPSATAKPIIEELITREAVSESQRAFLGVVGVDVTKEVSETYNMPEGVYIAQVSEGSAAEQAGVLRGDILTKFDGHEIDSMQALEEQLQYYSAGTDITITVMRADNGEYKEIEIPVTLGRKN